MNPSVRVTRVIELDLCEKGDDFAFASIELHLTCDVGPGCTLNGPYYPGAGDEVVLAHCVATGAMEGFSAPWNTLADAWLDRNQDEIIADAADKMDGERERHADYAGEPA